MIDSDYVILAYKRIKNYIRKTPIIESNLLNSILGHRIIFKVESTQKTGAYKVRGALNSVIDLQEKNKLPENFVAYSSGNHAQALAYASSLFDKKTTIFMPKYTSVIKQESAKNYGADIILTESRIEAEMKVKEYENKGYYNIPPSSSDMIVAGSGTICYEVLNQINFLPDAIFAPCGGGGLLSGIYVASKLFSDDILIYGGEPKNANDAAQSVASGKIVKFEHSPLTIADGARTLSIPEKNFEYLRKLAGIYEIEEDEILYWTAWIMNLTKVVCEPTAALSMAAAVRWLNEQTSPKNIIVILSGGNIDKNAYNGLSRKNYLEFFPSIDIFKNSKIIFK